MRKKIVMYFHRRPMNEDPFAGLGKKRRVYHRLFELGTEFGFDMFVASGKENYEPPLTFGNAYRYDAGIFKKYGSVDADAVFDRSGGLSFPPEKIGKKTLNDIVFKRLCNDKNAMYGLLSDFMPKNITIRSEEELRSALDRFDTGDIVVLKPSKGMQGNGILIGPASEISSSTLEPGKEYSLQEFVDTSNGIPGVIDGRHDLRIIIVEGKIILCHVRTPKEGSLLANVAQGGSIREVPIGNIPDFILDRVSEIQKKIDIGFDFPLYSIDFGIMDRKTPFVFELNDQIGFPSEDMDYEKFIHQILKSLERKASASI